MHPSIAAEINFRTSRSGGAGGQNVNKVETAVEGAWSIVGSQLFSEQEKTILIEKLANRTTKEGMVQVRSQIHRTQLANKQEVIERFNQLIQKALEKKRPRIATRLPKGVKERRLENKKITSQKKQNRSGRFDHF